MFKCRLPLLRLTPALHLLALPALLSSLVAYHQRLPQPRDITAPSISAVTLAAFPPLWFFGFLYYTDVPGIAFVLGSFVAQANDSNWLAALVSTQTVYASFSDHNQARTMELVIQTDEHHLDSLRICVSQRFQDALGATSERVQNSLRPTSSECNSR